jgi:hypothetical protein
MSVPIGPWLDSDAAQAIGPVEFVCTPQPGVRWLVLLLAAVLVPLGVLLLPIALSPGLLRDLGIPAIVTGSAGLDGAIALSFFAAALALALLFPRLGHRLLVGTQGLALWTRRGATVVFWDALGNLWRLTDDGTRSNRLVLERPDGRSFVVGWFFTDGDAVRQRVLAELERNRLGRQYERQNRTAPLDQLPERDDLPQGPWTHSAAARHIGPLESVHGPTLAVIVKTWTVLVGLVVLGVVLLVDALRRVASGNPDWYAVGLDLVLLGVAAAVALVAVRTMLQRLAWRVLVGARGLAEWHPTRELVVPWLELGETWLKRPAFGASVRLVLEQLNGLQLVLTTFFHDIDRIVDRVEAERVRTQNLSPAERRKRAQALNALLRDQDGSEPR